MWQALIKLIEKWSCNHDYETFKEIEVVNTDDTCIGHKYILICKKCGKIVHIKS